MGLSLTKTARRRQVQFKRRVFSAWLKLSGQRDKANKWQKGNDYFCSEFVMCCLRDSIKEEGSFLDIPEDDVVSPADIFRSKFFRYVGNFKENR